MHRLVSICSQSSLAAGKGQEGGKLENSGDRAVSGLHQDPTAAAAAHCSSATVPRLSQTDQARRRTTAKPQAGWTAQVLGKGGGQRMRPEVGDSAPMRDETSP